MLPDLEQLITLQQLENASIEARTGIEGLPARVEALDARLAHAAEDVAKAREQFDQHKADRQALENELAQVQTRLSRFKGQLMEVKTNKEYQAMQVEIAGAEAEVRRLEDRILERMLEADELTEEVKRAEKAEADERAAIEAEKSAIEQERKELESRLAQLDAERTERAGQLSPQVLSLFQTLARHRNGVAVVVARDGRCSSCQVRLRPQLFNHIRLNNTVIQCESCQRILYYESNPSGVPNAGATG